MTESKEEDWTGFAPKCPYCKGPMSLGGIFYAHVLTDPEPAKPQRIEPHCERYCQMGRAAKKRDER